jgi:kynurenine 3-monooxygenase
MSAPIFPSDIQPNSREMINIVGAGLVGSLLAIFLARRGFQARLLERRPDMRSQTISAGRSINLAISVRGINALKKLGLDKDILNHAVPMKGRMIHSPSGELTFQPYGTDDSQYINSISRATLNKILMTRAEEAGAGIIFRQRVADIDLNKNELYVVNEMSNLKRPENFQLVIGTDGSASAIRDGMAKLPGYEYEAADLDYGYKELVIPPDAAGNFKMERNALHIWPRGTFMLIALPNFEGSFTCTLFLPWKGPVSFEHLTTPEQVRRFFLEQFPDAVPLIADLEETFFQNPTGHMTTIKSKRWNVDGRVLLMGDAAHGIVPFFGQGMNCGFEDCTVLDESFAQFEKGTHVDWQGLFDHMTKVRVPNTNAIADMAVENFIEMRDKVADPHFLLEKAVEKILQKHFPGKYISRYALVTFSNVPYAFAMEAGIIEDALLRELCHNLDRAENVDLALAEKLIDQKLAPLLSPYARELATAAKH